MRWVFWFRQDLRTFDNLWFIEATKDFTDIFPIFIFDENIISNFWGFEDKKFLFLKEALLNLNKDLNKLWGKLTVYYWKPEEILPSIIKEHKIDKVYACKSYSRYWTQRDKEIACSWIELSLFNDYLMVEPDEVPQRKVFTPFYKLWQKHLELKDIKLASPMPYNQIGNNFEINSFLDNLILGDKHPYFTLDFWRDRLNKLLDSYSSFRNDLDKDWTTKLAPYLRFWIFSVRELYLKWLFERSESFISELAWREFWQHIAHYFPETKELEFQEKRRNIEWRNDDYLFEKWCKGETWYPVVDAAMKQLVETNWMHGRARMIVASFLTKDLLINWRLWEEFFKKHLLDYDENVNFWNWQWSASVWADPKPLRIFNPSLQSEKFDPSCIFIKKYLPELEFEEKKAIHNPLKYDLNYIKPIVDHNEAQKVAKEEYKKSSLTIN